MMEEFNLKFSDLGNNETKTGEEILQEIDKDLDDLEKASNESIKEKEEELGIVEEKPEI